MCLKRFVRSSVHMHSHCMIPSLEDRIYSVGHNTTRKILLFVLLRFNYRNENSHIFTINQDISLESLLVSSIKRAVVFTITSKRSEILGTMSKKVSHISMA